MFSGTFADLSFDGQAIEVDDGLATAVYLSLFTDRRAHEDDVPPTAPEDRRGWWGDAFPAVGGDRIGSRLWLLCREKQLLSVVARAKECAEESLQWMIEDGITKRVDVFAEISSPGTLGLSVTIVRPTFSVVQFRYFFAWASQTLKMAA